MTTPFKPVWGKESSLPQNATKGNVYFTTDTGKIFLDISNDINDRKMLYSSYCDIDIDDEVLIVTKGGDE